MDLSEMLNVLDTLLKIGNSVNIDTDKSIKWNLPVDIGLSVQEAGRVRVLFLSLADNLLLLLVLSLLLFT